MRFLLILTTLALLPVMVILHTAQFVRLQQPELEAAAQAILRKEGIQAAAAELRYLDLRISGNAPDPQALERATAALMSLPPTRLVSNEVSVPGSLRAKTDGKVLRLEGWLSDQAGIARVTARLAAARPDLQIDASGLRTSPHVRWLEGVTDPLAEDGPLLRGVLEKLRVAPSLHIAASEGALVITGTLPDEGAKSSVVRVLREAAPGRVVDASGVLISNHTIPATFAGEGALDPFLRSFYGTPAPGNFSLTLKEGPRLEAAATPTLEGEWMRLLRQVIGGVRVDMQLTLYPSVYHFPGYKPTTGLPAETLENIRRTISEFYVTFEAGSASLPGAAGTRLASLASALLGAGPALRLIVGGHPEPGGNVATQRKLALARAEQVRSFLIEQGAPAAEIEAVAFDAVPSGSPGAPLQPHSVEILIK